MNNKYKLVRYNGYVAVEDQLGTEFATVDDAGNISFCRSYNEEIIEGIIEFLKSKKII